MPEELAYSTEVLHPAVDTGTSALVVTESRAPVIFLNASRASLIAYALAAGAPLVLATDELSRLTPAFADVWREAGAAWVVRSPHGLREGFSGRRLESVAEVFTARPIETVEDVDLGHLAPGPADALELLATVSLRHRAQETTLLGGVVAGLAEVTTGGPPTLWGAHEPVGNLWDRAELTGFARQTMPGPTLLVATSPRLRATITVQRTSHGLEEISQVHADLGVPSTVAFEASRLALLRYLAELTTTTMPLVGLLLVRPGRSDLMIPPSLPRPPTPLALLIGPPGVRGLEIDVEAMVQRFGAQVVGRPRLPGLLFSLGSVGDPTWNRLDDILLAVGREKVDEVLGLTPDLVARSRG